MSERSPIRRSSCDWRQSAASAEHLELDNIVSQAAQLPANDRLAFLRAKCTATNLLLAQALEKLRISSPQWWDMSIESRVFDRADGLHERTGEMIGPYRVIRSIGVGGMGEVVLAERDDHQFHQQVAISWSSAARYRPPYKRG